MPEGMRYLAAMRLLPTLFTIAFACFLIVPASAQKKSKTTAPNFSAVDHIMNQRVKDGKLVGGVVAISLNGKVVHFKAYGHADREAGKKMETDTIFRIYSMSKSITSAAALILADEGKLDIDAPVSAYIPSWAGMKTKDGKTPARPMKVRELFTHTSGIGYDGNVLDRYAPLQEMIDKLAAKPLHFEPGSDWMYGASIDVLGYLVEKQSGQSLADFLQQRVFEPLGMEDTAFYVHKEKRDRYAALYKNKDGKLVPDDDKKRFFKRPTGASGGGGLTGTTGDYLKFLQMVANDGKAPDGTVLLKPDTVKLMVTDQMASGAGVVTFGKEERGGVRYGLGFNVRTAMSDWDPSGKVGEFGWGGKASTHYWGHPDNDLLVVTMEQTLPYSFGTEWAVKKAIYDAVAEK